MIVMPMVHSVQTVHLSYAEINTIYKWTETSSTHQRHIGVPSGATQNDFRAYGMFGANRACILHRD
jgi:hypothetical protein